MSGYGQILRLPGIAPLIASQLVARSPGGMLSIAIIMHIHNLFGSYAFAGLAVASFSVGAAVAGPVTSRWMSSWGMRQVLILTTIVFVATLVVIASVDLVFPAYLVAGVLLGAANPPVQSAVRTIYPKIVNAKQLTAVFSLDASAQELIWVLGPMIAALVAVQFSTMAALLLTAVLALGGGLWFILQPSVGMVRIPHSSRRIGTVLTKPPVFFMVIIGMALIATCGAIEAATVAELGEDGIASGIVLAAFSAGSLTGGLAIGNAKVTRWSLVRRMTVVAVGAGLASIVMNAWWIGAMLVLAGLGIAPALGLLFTVVSSSVRFSDTAEAYGWVGTGQLIGSALGSAAAGFAVDTGGPQTAFVVGALLAVITVVLSIIARPWMPDLNDGAAGPLPDTAPTQVIG